MFNSAPGHIYVNNLVQRIHKDLSLYLQKNDLARNLATTDSSVFIPLEFQPDSPAHKHLCQLRSAHIDSDSRDTAPHSEAIAENGQIVSKPTNAKRVCNDISITTSCYDNASKVSTYRTEISTERKRTRDDPYQQIHMSVLQKESEEFLKTAKYQRNN